MYVYYPDLLFQRMHIKMAGFPCLSKYRYISLQTHRGVKMNKIVIVESKESIEYICLNT